MNKYLALQEFAAGSGLSKILYDYDIEEPEKPTLFGFAVNLIPATIDAAQNIYIVAGNNTENIVYRSFNENCKSQEVDYTRDIDDGYTIQEAWKALAEIKEKRETT